MKYTSNAADRLLSGSDTSAYQILESRCSTVQTITAKEPLTGRTLTFRWEGEFFPTQEDMARLFAQVERMRSPN